MNILRIRKMGVPVFGIYVVLAHRPGGLGQRARREKGQRQSHAACTTCSGANVRWRKPTASLLNAFGKITIVPKGEMFEVTDQPAMLKVDV